MEKRIIQGILVIGVAIFSSCEKKEIPAKAYDRGNAKEASIVMGPSYEYQIYFNLEDNKVVKQNLKTEWDIALSCDEDPVIVLNTSRNMLAAKSEVNDLNSITDTIGLKFNMDFPSGDKDSLSVGRLGSKGGIWVIWLGYDIDGNDLGYVKIDFKPVGSGNVQFIYAGLKSNEFKTGELIANSAYNHVFYSLINNRSADIEPTKNSYDLWFTQYLHFFLEPEITPYLVAGALLNPSSVRASRMEETDFKSITLNDTAAFPLTGKYDIIGYDWKDFFLSQNAYTIVPNLNFIVRPASGFYFKLRFVDFYDKDGLRGTPKFEFIKL